MELPDRFWDKVMPEPNSGCWLWTACVNSDGYGCFRINDKLVLAHRLSYQAHKESIPDGLQIDHICRVRSCVNPFHLNVVTNKQNHYRSPIQNINKTHCPKGHPYDEQNTYRHPNGSRVCKTCRKRNDKRSAQRRRERLKNV